MSRTLELARWLRHGSDVRRATIAQQRLMGHEKRLAEIGNPLPWDLEAGTPTFLIGQTADGRAVKLDISTLLAHLLLLGPTRVGKTALMSLLVDALRSFGIISIIAIGAGKNDSIEYTRAVIAKWLMGLPREQAEEVLGRVIVLAPASGSHLVPLDLTAPEPGRSSELQASDLTRSQFITHAHPIGPKQEDIAYLTFRLLIETRLPANFFERPLRDPAVAQRLAERTANPDLYRGYLDRLRREYRNDAVLGLVARANTHYRHEPVRLAVGGAEGVTIHAPDLFADKIVLVDLTAPYGTEDVIRFIGSTLWSRLVRASLSRPVGSPNCFVLADEFQQLLQSEQDAALALENLLRLCAARGVWWWLATQTLAGLERYGSSLSKVIAVNTTFKAIFRTSDTIDGMLPVTGRRRRPWATAPWQKPADYYLSRSEERAYLAEQLSSLGPRLCYVQHAKSGRAGTLIHTADATVSMPEDCPDFIRVGLERGTLAVPVEKLRRGLDAAERRFAELVDVPRAAETARTEPMVIEVSSPKRESPRARPMEMG
jgi:hypothetical protein